LLTSPRLGTKTAARPSFSDQHSRSRSCRPAFTSDFGLAGENWMTDDESRTVSPLIIGSLNKTNSELRSRDARSSKRSKLFGRWLTSTLLAEASLHHRGRVHCRRRCIHRCGVHWRWSGICRYTFKTGDDRRGSWLWHSGYSTIEAGHRDYNVLGNDRLLSYRLGRQLGCYGPLDGCHKAITLRRIHLGVDRLLTAACSENGDANNNSQRRKITHRAEHALGVVVRMRAVNISAGNFIRTQ
jgi:hypothetical protein